MALALALDDREKAIRRRLRDDFPHYAEKCLRIRTKAGKVEPLVLNRAQRHVHDKLEDQKARTGKVRALILKARQQGFSTYIEGRFYHQTTHRTGTQAFILTHEQAATDNLFGMADRYHTHCPALVKPHTGSSNAKELSFDLLDSGYSVGTAGSKAVGRSKTAQLFHGSEVGFWPNAAEHFAGVVQTIPDLPETEIILETTGNGPTGEFHKRWQDAEAGRGDYIAIFVPWFWSEEYRRAVPEGFGLDDDEVEYAALHGLDLEQMVWRRAKLIELGDPLLFMQEYPATATEAFQTTGHDSFISAGAVLRARKASCEGVGPLVLGVDPARSANGRFSVAWRRGRKVERVEHRPITDLTIGASWIKQIIDDDAPDRVFIDVGGLGAGVVDILKSWGEPYCSVVVPVNFGSAPTEPERLLPDGTKKPGPKNRRSEMWSRSRDWLDEEGGADIPDDDAIHSDACAPGYGYDPNQRLLLESKDHMAARGVRSPDLWDSVVLTFAAPVRERPKAPPTRRAASGGGWMGR